MAEYDCALNQKTINDRYPIAYISSLLLYILQQIRATQYLSSIDLNDAFWQVKLDPDSRIKMAFNGKTGRVHFQFVRLPFGLCNSA